jgi:outer membrane receptor for ferrienterochelin and colicin
MKKKFAILLFCGFLSISIQAQNFGGGLILGLSTSQVSGDKLGGFNKAGVLVGVFANKSLSEILSIQMEMTYIQKGSRNPNNTDIHEYDLNYLEIPFFLKYQTKYELKIEGGFLTGILINQTERYSDGIELINMSNGNFNKFDFGVGLGIDYSLTDKLTLNSRVSNTLFFSPTREYSVQTFINRGNYNSVLSFALHYIL